MKEYKIAKGWAIFIYILGPLFIVLFSWIFIQSFTTGDFTSNANWILIPVSIAMIALMLVGIIEAYKGRLLIYEDRMVSIGTFSTRELKFNEIKGFTTDANYIFIKPYDKQKKQIKISRYIGEYHELLAWLSKTFTDLEEQIVCEEKQAILNDEDYGWTEEIREKNLMKAQRTSRIINWTAGVVMVWILFNPTPYPYSIMVAMIIPIVALLTLKLSSGLIRVDEREGGVYPSVAYAFILPSCGLTVRAFDYEIFDYSNVWPVTLVITLSFLALLLIKQKEITFKKVYDYFFTLLVAVFLFAYSFGTVIHLNCYYDDSETQCFTARVLEKRVSSGKMKRSYLKLSAWGKQEEIEEISIDKDFYKRVEIGDEVNIHLFKGKLDIPWIYVTDE